LEACWKTWLSNSENDKFIHYLAVVHQGPTFDVILSKYVNLLCSKLQDRNKFLNIARNFARGSWQRLNDKSIVESKGNISQSLDVFRASLLSMPFVITEPLLWSDEHLTSTKKNTTPAKRFRSNQELSKEEPPAKVARTGSKRKTGEKGRTVRK
jgi:hypothetical protein